MIQIKNNQLAHKIRDKNTFLGLAPSNQTLNECDNAFRWLHFSACASRGCCPDQSQPGFFLYFFFFFNVVAVFTFTFLEMSSQPRRPGCSHCHLKSRLLYFLQPLNGNESTLHSFLTTFWRICAACGQKRLSWRTRQIYKNPSLESKTVHKYVITFVWHKLLLIRRYANVIIMYVHILSCQWNQGSSLVCMCPCEACTHQTVCVYY